MSRSGVGNAVPSTSYSGTADPAPAAEDCDPIQGCITCGDVAVPLRVELIDVDRCLALCEDADGRRETVEIGLVEPVVVGERLLVHAGTAIAHVGAVEGQAPR